MPSLFFDTNFFRKFIEDESFFDKANNQLAKKYLGIPPQEMKLFVSPFAFIEYMGIKVGMPPSPSGLLPIKPLKTFDDAIALAAKLYEYAYKYFDKLPSLSENQLKETLEHRNKHVHDKGMPYFTIATARYLKTENRHILIHCLAIEYSQKFPMKKSSATIYHCSLWIDAARWISQGMDVCMFRGVHWRWQNEKPTERLKSFGRDLTRTIEMAMGVRIKDDLVDTELVHYSVFGKLNGTNLMPIDCYTCDQPEKTKLRLHVFHEGLKKTIDEVNHAIGDSNVVQKYPTDFHPGEITFFKHETGDIVDGPVNVRKLVVTPLKKL